MTQFQAAGLLNNPCTYSSFLSTVKLDISFVCSLVYSKLYMYTSNIRSILQWPAIND